MKWTQISFKSNKEQYEIIYSKYESDLALCWLYKTFLFKIFQYFIPSVIWNRYGSGDLSTYFICATANKYSARNFYIKLNEHNNCAAKKITWKIIRCAISHKHSAWFVEGNNLSVLPFVLGTQKKRYSFLAPVEQKPYQINMFSK